MSEERRIYDPGSAPRWTPAKDWVELTDGSWICVWELSVPEQFQVAEAAQRHPQDPRPGGNEKEASVWLLAYACRRGDSPDSGRVFGDLEISHLLTMAPENFGRLLASARGLVQQTEAEEERQRDFTPEPDIGRRDSLIGASNTSTGSR